MKSEAMLSWPSPFLVLGKLGPVSHWTLQQECWFRPSQGSWPLNSGEMDSRLICGKGELTRKAWA